MIGKAVDDADEIKFKNHNVSATSQQPFGFLSSASFNAVGGNTNSISNSNSRRAKSEQRALSAEHHDYYFYHGSDYHHYHAYLDDDPNAPGGFLNHGFSSLAKRLTSGVRWNKLLDRQGRKVVAEGGDDEGDAGKLTEGTNSRSTSPSKSVLSPSKPSSKSPSKKHSTVFKSPPKRKKRNSTISEYALSAFDALFPWQKVGCRELIAASPLGEKKGLSLEKETATGAARKLAATDGREKPPKFKAQPKAKAAQSGSDQASKHSKLHKQRYETEQSKRLPDASRICGGFASGLGPGHYFYTPGGIASPPQTTAGSPKYGSTRRSRARTTSPRSSNLLYKSGLLSIPSTRGDRVFIERAGGAAATSSGNNKDNTNKATSKDAGVSAKEFYPKGHSFSGPKLFDKDAAEAAKKSYMRRAVPQSDWKPLGGAEKDERIRRNNLGTWENPNGDINIKTSDKTTLPPSDGTRVSFWDKSTKKTAPNRRAAAKREVRSRRGRKAHGALHHSTSPGKSSHKSSGSSDSHKGKYSPRSHSEDASLNTIGSHASGRRGHFLHNSHIGGNLNFSRGVEFQNFKQAARRWKLLDQKYDETLHPNKALQYDWHLFGGNVGEIVEREPDPALMAFQTDRSRIKVGIREMIQN
jgi:hypothetical protein